MCRRSLAARIVFEVAPSVFTLRTFEMLYSESIGLLAARLNWPSIQDLGITTSPVSNWLFNPSSKQKTASFSLVTVHYE
jgi:hypothetical protein